MADLDFQGKGKQPVNLPPTCHSRNTASGGVCMVCSLSGLEPPHSKVLGPHPGCGFNMLRLPKFSGWFTPKWWFPKRNLLFIFGAIFRWAMLNFGAGKIYTIFALPCFTHHSATNGSRIPRRLSHSINWGCRNKKSSNFYTLPTILPVQHSKTMSDNDTIKIQLNHHNSLWLKSSRTLRQKNNPTISHKAILFTSSTIVSQPSPAPTYTPQKYGLMKKPLFLRTEPPPMVPIARPRLQLFGYLDLSKGLEQWSKPNSDMNHEILVVY